MPFNHVRSQQHAHRIITRWGGLGNLVRAGVKRSATMARLEYNARERGLYQEGAERIILSAYGLTVPPDQNLDLVEFMGKQYRIILPPVGPRPKDVVIYYDLSVMFNQAV